jgi:Ca-activated chloride channel family protein
MKQYWVARFLVIILLIAGVSLPVSAQSGRKRQVKSPSQTTTQDKEKTLNQDSSKNDPEEEEEEEKPSSKPLADNTPTTVTDDGTIKLETSLVTIPVSVINSEGKFFSNLKKRNFTIFEDGVKQDIASFASIEVPFHVVLTLDTSGSTRFKLEDIQAAAFAFVKQLRAEDKVMIVSFDNSVYQWSDFTNDRELLRQAIYQTKTGGSTKLYEAVDLGISEFLAQVNGRKAVVLFTDGVDTASRRSSARSTLKLVQESDAIIYPVRYDTEADNDQGGILSGPGGLPFPIPGKPRTPNPRNPRDPRTPPTSGKNDPRLPIPFNRLTNFAFPGQWPRQGPIGTPAPEGADDYRFAERYLKDLATNSGGQVYEADNLQNLSDAFSAIAEDLRNQYTLSYYPSNAVRDGSYRQIKVKVNKKGAIVRARDGYRAVPSVQPRAMNENQKENQKENRKKPGYKRKQVAGNN